MTQSLFERLVQFDRTRKSFPGEHWLALATGLWFLKRKGRSLPSTLVSKAIGAAFIVRAASGRDGLQKLWKDNAVAAPAAGSSLPPFASPGSSSMDSSSPSPLSMGSSSMGSSLTGHPPLEGEELAPGGSRAPQRAALLQPPEALDGESSPESASRARAGGFPDFR